MAHHRKAVHRRILLAIRDVLQRRERKNGLGGSEGDDHSACALATSSDKDELATQGKVLDGFIAS